MRPSCYNKTMAVKQIILVALTVMLGVGCANTEDGMPEEKHVISIAPYTEGDATRGTPILTASDLTQIEIHALRSDSHQPYFTDTARKNPSNNLFTFNTPYYWLPGASLDFCAITPSAYVSGITCDGRLSFDYCGTAEGGGDDIMTGCAYGLDYENSQGVVPINMQHALSMIEFAVAYELVDGEKVAKIGKDIIITSLGLKNIAIAGHCQTYDLNMSWTAEAPVNCVIQDFTEGGTTEGLRVGKDINAGDVINLPDRSKAFYVIPNQVLTTIQVSFIEGAPTPYTKEIAITPIHLQPGKHYIFHLAIKSNEVSVTSTLVTKWTDGGTSEETFQ